LCNDFLKEFVLFITIVVFDDFSWKFKGITFSGFAKFSGFSTYSLLASSSVLAVVLFSLCSNASNPFKINVFFYF
jgi:hypothetical protein